MPGAYVTQERSLPEPDYVVRSGIAGEPGQDFPVLFPVTNLGQETFSYRTVREAEVGDVDIANSRRVFRNGFTTYDPQTDKGHEFLTTKRYVEYSRGASAFIPGNWRGKPTFFRGLLLPKMSLARPDIPAPQVAPLTSSEVITEGQAMINRAAPTAPRSQLLLAQSETLTSGLPALPALELWRSGLSDIRKYGSEYLNLQYAWAPLIADIRAVVESLSNASAVVRQLQRDNGRNVRRHVRLPQRREVTETVFLRPPASQGPYHGYNLSREQYFTGSGPFEIRQNTVTTRDIWFSGAFTYAIPTDKSVLSRIERYSAMADVLLGTRVTPELLWELAPWSWLVDWKIAIGSAISAATRVSNDNLVLRYGYLMCHQKVVRQYHVPPLDLKVGGRTPPVTLNLVTESKERRRSTPYGFGLKMESLTPFQWSILAALGMTKAPRKLFPG